jgi:hypothetical protein
MTGEMSHRCHTAGNSFISLQTVTAHHLQGTQIAGCAELAKRILRTVWD